MKNGHKGARSSNSVPPYVVFWRGIPYPVSFITESELRAPSPTNELFRLETVS